MRRPLDIVVTDVAKAQILSAEEWWRLNRPKAPGAIGEELERASSLIAAQPGVGSTARDADLAGVRRLHLARVRYDIYYRVNEDLERVEVLAFWHASRGRQPVL
jgi:plasmid stabilization system protein ParE